MPRRSSGRVEFPAGALSVRGLCFSKVRMTFLADTFPRNTQKVSAPDLVPKGIRIQTNKAFRNSLLRKALCEAGDGI